MITLIASGSAPSTPIASPSLGGDLVQLATWTGPPVGSSTLYLTYTAGPSPTVQVVVWALGVDGVWRADRPFPLALLGGPVGVRGCTPDDEVIASIFGYPKLVPAPPTVAPGNVAVPPPPPQLVVPARTILVIGFAVGSVPIPGTYTLSSTTTVPQ